MNLALSKNYMTVSGDVVDRICWLFYGYTEGATEAVFERNRFLLELPSVLPAGVLIVLPPHLFEPTRQQLWDYVSPRTVAESAQSAFLNDQAALAEFRAGRGEDIYVGYRPAELYSPESNVVPVIVGEDGTTPIIVPPTSGGNIYPPSQVETFDYVAVYYRDANNALRVGYVPREQFSTGQANELLVKGRL